MADLTPQYTLLPAEIEIQIPSLINDAPAQTVGGFVASQNGFNSPNMQISAVSQQILVGSATSPTVGVGIFIGSDQAATVGYDFRAGDPAGNYIWWDASAGTLTVVGAISISAGGTIGGFNVGADYIRDVANSFGIASTVTAGDDVRFWAGDTFANRATAPARITEAGAATFSSMTITGGAISGTPISSSPISGIPNSSATDISLLGFTQNLVFTSTSASAVAWTSGTITLSNGRTFSISSGTKSAIAALTYVYLDTGASTTVLQTTTTFSTAIGANKILIAAVQNNTTAASIITYGGGQPIIDGGAQIAALSIVAASIAANTITAAKLTVSQLSAIAADLGTITTGVINMSSGTANIHAGQSAWDTGTGFWLEYNSGTPRFSIGNSAGNKITWDGTTLTIVGAENVSKIFTAAETIAANDALYLDGYQSDGGPTFDTGTASNSTADGSGNATITTPITIGSNSNRLIIFCLVTSASTSTGVTAAWNGTGMTASQVGVPAGGARTYLFYLLAPTTGAHNITLAGFNAGELFRYTVHSYYNIKQTGQPDTSTSATVANPPGTALSASITPTTPGSLLFAYGLSDSRTDGSASGIPNNNESTTSGTLTLIAGDNGPINIINAQTVTMSDGGTSRKVVQIFAFAPQTTAVPAVRKTSSVSTTKSGAFIGFASASATAGNNVTVITDGTVSGFSGLTFGRQYYINDTAGTIGTSPGSVTRKAGISVASTALKITNIW